jgi:YidC/Oxa1 family membrane protein insertase
MDKKNTFLGAFFIIAAFASLYLSQRLFPHQPAPPAAVRAAVAEQTANTAAAPATAATGAAATPTVSGGPQAAFAATSTEHAGAKVTILENDFIAVRFTDFGGAVSDVALKKYPAAQGRPDAFIFNELHADPMLAFTEFPGLDRATRYDIVSQTASEIVFRAVLDGKLEVTRRYILAPSAGEKSDPYQLRYETTFRNLTAQTGAPLRVSLALGTAAPVNALDAGLQLSTGYAGPDAQNFIARSKLEGGSGFFGIGASEAQSSIASGGPIAWAAVKNQFFASILTPDEPGTGLVTRRVKLLAALPDTDHNAYGIAGVAQFDVKPLAAGGTAALAGNFYVGPKEYKRLANTDVFKADQDKVMEYGFFKFFAQLLVTLMNWMHSVIPNWGLAIVLSTLILKILFIPATVASTRSMKRMAQLQPELAAIKEKFKDNPQKQQMATMALFKERKVNPVGGCLPQLLTMPFFLGFYSMLQSTAELRYAPFLWAHDLSAPDTIMHLGGLPLNILPLLLGVTMVVQMRMTPTSPTMDQTQATMMKFMPVIFTLFCYNLPAALSLYSTTNGLFTIAQMMIINRLKDPAIGPIAVANALSSSKPVKNVTPKKR